ncbi:hypothetical protein LCGC14_2285970, partial [marine sediment metagenome]
PKEIKKTEEWLRDTPEGQQYLRKIFDKYKIGRVMSMLENTVLMMAGQSVIDQPRQQGGGMSTEQRAEKKRLDQLGEALQGGTISNTEFEDAKRKGLTLTQLMQGRKGEAVRLNMRKKAETFLTQEGYRIFKLLRETEGEELPELYGLLSTFKDIPEFTVQELIDEMRMSGQSPEAIEEMLEAWRVAHEQGLLSTEDSSVKGTEYDLPGNMPEGIASKLNMRKDAEGDVTGPGGDSWEYEWTSGPTPTKDEPQKRKLRFPFHNKPSGYTPGEGDQGNLHDVGPLGGQSDMNYLANVIESMTKTADNDLFSIHSFDNGEKWLTYTLFKKAYSKFCPGDIVVQYGKTAVDCRTYRRRFGTIAKAEKSLINALSPILATVVGQPTPDDSLHDLQKGAPPGGAYGPRTSPYDLQPEQGNRDGFDAKNTPRTRTKRKFIPHMDQADDEGSGFMGGRTMGSRRNIFADARLTPKGEATLQELQASTVDPNAADLYVVLSSVDQSNLVTSEEVYLNKASAIEDVWSTALKDGLIISEDLPEAEEFLGELPGGMPEGIANRLNLRKQADFNPAAPVVETPEERAAVIEQPAV